MSGSELSRPERLQIMLSAEEVSALDDWRFAKRMPSRAAAVRELLRRGLAAEGAGLDTAGRQSASFGVLDEAEAKPDGNGAGRQPSRPGGGGSLSTPTGVKRGTG